MRRLDNVLRGGILPGDVIEIFGKTGSGKSWLCMQILAQYIFFHEEPSHVLYLDMKNDFDARRLNNLCGLSMTRDPDKARCPYRSTLSTDKNNYNLFVFPVEIEKSFGYQGA